MEEFTFKSEPICKINLSVRGVACEKAKSCEWATDNCNKMVYAERMVCDPTRRWMYCYAWKQKLGMVFDKELGVYILPETKKILMERAGH